MKRLALLLILTACGTEPAPKAPEPTQLTAPTPPMPPPAPGPMSVGLCWDYNVEPDISHYTVFANEVPGKVRPAKYTQVTTTNSVRFDGLHHDTAYFFFVTATNTANVESEPSDEIGFIRPEMGIRLNGGKVLVSFKRPMPTAPGVTYRLMATREVGGEWFEIVDVAPRVIAAVSGVEQVEYEVPVHDGAYRFFKVHVDIAKEGCAE